MDPIIDFAMRAAIFMAFFLLISYLLFRHIERMRLLYGEPEDKNNYMMILKHFFFKRLSEQEYDSEIQRKNRGNADKTNQNDDDSY